MWRRGRVALLVSLAVASVCSVVLTFEGGLAWAAPSWGAAVWASLPSDVDVTGPSANLLSVSCASVGNCSAVGTYQDSSFHTQGVLLSESGGVWQAGGRAILPSGASADPRVYLGSVSCGSVGNCGAVGTYYDSSGREGLLLSESGGVWQAGVKASLPAGASSVSLSSVSCASAGNCSAVGTYYDSSSNEQVVLFSEVGGVWQAGVEGVLPSDATSSLLQASLRSVSCASAGNCSAVGYYYNTSGEQGLLLSESGGVWQAGEKAALPSGAQSNPSASLTSVSCASAGNCSAVGAYSANSGSQGLLLSESGGTWQAGTNAVLPSGASSTNPGPNLRSVSCASAGNCSAVGNYFDSSNQSQGFLLSESGGAWQPGVQAVLPSGAYSSPNVQLPSVSCPSAGNCSAAGTYYDNSSTVRQGLLISESGGVWHSGVKAVLPPDASTSPSVEPPSVSCASADDCSAVGDYNDSSGRQQGFLLGATASSPAVPAAPGVSSPSDGQTVTGSGASGVSVPVAATGVPGGTLSVSEGGSLLASFPIDSAGNASGTLTLPFGSHALSFTQTAGGQTSSATTVHVSAAPAAASSGGGSTAGSQPTPPPPSGEPFSPAPLPKGPTMPRRPISSRATVVGRPGLTIFSRPRRASFEVLCAARPGSVCALSGVAVINLRHRRLVVGRVSARVAGQQIGTVSLHAGALNGLPRSFRGRITVRFVSTSPGLSASTTSVSMPVAPSVDLRPPEVRTGDASGILPPRFDLGFPEGRAMLTGLINPMRWRTSYHFEFGLAAGQYVVQSPAADAPAGADRLWHLVSTNIAEQLIYPGATIHYRLVADSLAGPRYGEDRSFQVPLALGTEGPPIPGATSVGPEQLTLAYTCGGNFLQTGSILTCTGIVRNLQPPVDPVATAAANGDPIPTAPTNTTLDAIAPAGTLVAFTHQTGQAIPLTVPAGGQTGFTVLFEVLHPGVGAQAELQSAETTVRAPIPLAESPNVGLTVACSHKEPVTVGSIILCAVSTTNSGKGLANFTQFDILPSGGLTDGRAEGGAPPSVLGIPDPSNPEIAPGNATRSASEKVSFKVADGTRPGTRLRIVVVARGLNGTDRQPFEATATSTALRVGG